MIRTSTHILIITAIVALLLSGCRKTEIKKEYVTVESYEDLPQLTTLPLDSVLNNEAYGGCKVLYEGKNPVTECGLCWDTDPQPLRLGSHIGTGSGKGITKGKIEGLRPSTKYYVRAYAKNSEGIAYGNEITFTTPAGWVKLGSVPNNFYVSELFVANGVFYASASNYIYVSADQAKTWNSVITSGGCFAASGNSVYAGTNYFLYVTTDNGTNWTSKYVGYNVIDVLVTDAIYAITSNGLSKSVNNGQAWSAQNNGLSGNLNSLAAKNNDLYVASSNGIFKSTNSAAGWSQVRQGLDVQNISVSGANILAGTAQGVYISKDNGTTWNAIGILPGLSTRVYGSGKNAIAWSSGSNLVYTSSDEGLTWKKMTYHESENPGYITGDGNNYYASSNSGIFKLAVNSK